MEIKTRGQQARLSGTERVWREKYSILFGFRKKWVKWMGVMEWGL